MSDQAGKPILTTRQGHPVHNNQQQRTVGTRGPATLENYHFLEKISHFDRERIPERVVHARGFVAHGEFEAYGHDRRRARLEVHPRQAVPGKGKKTPAGHPVLHRHRRPRLLRGRPRPARLRGQVLYRGRQLGPRRQQPPGLLHPRRDQVPGRHPRAQAGPGDVPPGAEPDLRLHEPDARVDAHADLPVQPARHPGQLPAHGRLRREHLQDGQRPGRDRAGQVSLAPAAGRRSPDGRRRPPRMQANDLGSASKDLYEAIERGDYPQWDLYVQIMERRRASRAGLRPAGRHEDLAGGRLPAAADRHDDAQPQRRRLPQRERADRHGHRRAGGRPRLLRRQDAGRPDLLLLRHPALPGRPELPAAAGQPARARTSE